MSCLWLVKKGARLCRPTGTDRMQAIPLLLLYAETSFLVLCFSMSERCRRDAEIVGRHWFRSPANAGCRQYCKCANAPARTHARKQELSSAGQVNRASELLCEL